MKKALLATTALLMTAAGASAEISLSGFGRFGLDHNSGAAAGTAKTQINMRMRVNIDGSVETDSGVKFGGRIRLQYNDGDTAAALSPAMLYAAFSGVRFEIGNANTAYDSAALMYNSEIGYLDRGFGDPNGNYYSFSTGAYSGAETNRMGMMVAYSAGAFNVRLSYVTPDQTVSTLPAGTSEEVGISADYNFGQFTVSAAYADNAAGVSGESVAFLGAEYAVSSAANVGLLWFEYNALAAASDSTRVTLYGNYKVNAYTIKGYVATDDQAGLATDVAYGLGVDYDLGGARVAGDIHRNYANDTIVGLGVRFDF
ncbi:MAG: porin [Xanthobacteraceae bacterium]|nr:MAG: porin [Xanthobacteraceae bacterium]